MTTFARLLPAFLTTLFCSICFMLPALAVADSLHVRSDTLVKGFERDISPGNSEIVAPAYQYFTIDTLKDEPGGFSFHGQGWGRLDINDSGYFTDSTDGELNYAYLEYASPIKIFNLRLGRMPLYGGGANENLDGLWLSAGLNRYLSFSAYGGLPVAVSTENGRGGDSLYGGRLSLHKGSSYEVGLFYKKLENDNNSQKEDTGLDVYASLPMDAILYGSSTLNLDSEGWSQHLYEVRIPISSMTFRPYFEYYNYQDFFGTGDTVPNPFKILGKTREDLTTYGLDATWKTSEDFTLAAKVKQYSFGIADSSAYASVLGTWSNEDEGLIEYGGELGYLKGDAAGNDYLLLRVFGYDENLGERFWVDLASAEIVYAAYDKDIFGQGSSLFGSLSLGKKFMDDALHLSLTGDYSKTPYYDEDLRALFKMTYLFDFNM